MQSLLQDCILQDWLFLHFDIRLKENFGMIKCLKLAANFIVTINFLFLFYLNNLQFQSNTSKYTNLGVYPVSYIARKVKSVIFAKYHISLER